MPRVKRALVRAALAGAAILLLANSAVLIGSAVLAPSTRGTMIALVVGAVFAGLGGLWVWVLGSLTRLDRALKATAPKSPEAGLALGSLSVAMAFLSCFAALCALATLSAMILRLASGVSVFD